MLAKKKAYSSFMVLGIGLLTFTPVNAENDSGSVAGLNGSTEESRSSPAFTDPIASSHNVSRGSDPLGINLSEGGTDPSGEVVVREVTVHPESALLYVDEMARFRAEVEFEDPEEADEEDEEVYWSSSNAEVATVDQEGLVTGVAEGQVTITATSMADRRVSGSAEIEVQEAGRTGTLRPGEFTHFEGGLIIGTHPEAEIEAITVETEWFDPTEESGFPEDEGIRPGQFVEITATDIDEELIDVASDTEFFVFMPVSERLDASKLQALFYEYETFITHLEENNWIDMDGGVFDRENHLYMTPAYIIGGPEYPTRLGIIEQMGHETENFGPILEWVEEYFSEGSVRFEHNEGNSSDEGSNGMEPMGQVDDFVVLCKFRLVSCNSSLADAYIPIMEEALQKAKERYTQLENDPSPRLRKVRWYERSLVDEGHQGKYKYYFKDEESLRNNCDKYRGQYYGGTSKAYTCLNAADDGTDQLARTTRHELFHSIQADLTLVSTWRAWVREGTAAMNEEIDLLVTRNTRAVDIKLYETGSFAYQIEQFWLWLFERAGLEQKDIGILLDDGISTGAARRFIIDYTPFDSISEAHWHWTRNAAFEGTIELPDNGNDILYSHQCELNLGAFENTPEVNGIERLPGFDVPLSSGAFTVDFEIENKTAGMYEFIFESLDYPHYYEFSIDTDDDRAWIYTEETQYNPATGECDEFDDSTMLFHPDVDNEYFPQSGNIGRVDNHDPSGTRSAYLLVSNDAKLFDRDYKVTVDGPHRLYELTVSSTADGEVSQPGEDTFIYDKDTEVTLQAEPDENYVFKEWVGDTDNVEDPASATTTVTMEDDYQVIATYAPRRDLSVGICGAGTVELTPIDVDDKYLAERPRETFGYAEGDTVLLEAVPNENPDPEWNPHPGQDPAGHPQFATWEAEDPDEFFDDEVVDPDAEFHPNPELELPMLTERMGEDGQTREIRALFTGGETPCIDPPEPDIPTVIGDPDPINIDIGISINDMIDFGWIYPGSGPDYFFTLEVRVHEGNGEAGELVYTADTRETSYSVEASKFEPGVEYLWKVKAIHDSGLQSAFSRPLYFGVSPDDEIDISIGFEDPTSRDSYQLVGLPGQIDLALSETVSGEPETGWRAFRETGAENPEEALVEYDRSDGFHFRPGRGFWLLAQEGWSFEGEISSFETRREDSAIEINEGWNLISNPLMHDLDWNKIQAVNDLETPLWQWNGSWQQAGTFASSAHRGQAYYFYNQDREREQLYLTVEEDDDDEHEKTLAEVKDQSELPAPFSLDAFVRDKRSSGVSVGLTDNNEQALYYQAPPAHFEEVSLRITDTEPGTGNADQEYARVVVPEQSGPGQTFNLTLRGEPGTGVDFYATGIHELTDGEVYLVDPVENHSHDLKQNPEITVSINNADGEMPLHLLIGSKDYVKESVTPEEFALRPPYPNPFNSSVSVKYDLAKDSNIKITAYNSVGQQITVIEEGTRSAGSYVARWNPANLASGTYFIRLEADGRTYIQQLSHIK